MQRLPAEIATLYTELVERLIAFEARRSIGHAAGTFVTKQVKGHDYYYFQHSGPGGVAQVYLGRKTPELQAVARRFGEERGDAAAERADLERLCALLRAGGAVTTDAPAARVLAALADAAVFRLGGVLVGTHAFIAMNNLLGVRFEQAALRTDDVDIAGERALAIAVPDLQSDIPAALDSLQMGFLPVPGLSPKDPATSFKVRGRSLRVDLLTPARDRGGGGPILIPRFAAAAQPLPYLEFLLEDAQSAAVVSGAGVLVQVPHPARFALHKLVVATSRVAAFQAKADKDVRQAAQLIGALAEDRPGDLALAWAALAGRGDRWQAAAARGLALLERRAPDAAALLRAHADPTSRRRRR